jgi:hypothetical protein
MFSFVLILLDRRATDLKCHRQAKPQQHHITFVRLLHNKAGMLRAFKPFQLHRKKGSFAAAYPLSRNYVDGRKKSGNTGASRACAVEFSRSLLRDGES